MKIIADSAIPFLRGAVENYADIEYIVGSEIDAHHLKDAEVLIVRTRTRCDASLLDGSSIKVIATATIGYDHIDLDYCHRRAIRVITAAGCNARGVLQWIGATLVHFAKRDGWVPSQKTLGVVGVGHVGSLIKMYAEEWGFKVLCCDPPREMVEHLGFCSIEELAANVDIVTFHTTLNDTTCGVVNSSFLNMLSPQCIVINSSRGDIVVGADLLKSNHQYALDVWQAEPNIDIDLLNGATIATPHIAGYSLQGKANASSMVVRRLSQLYGWGVDDWFPEGVQPSSPKNISWKELCNSIGSRYDIEQDMAILKSSPNDFETIRDNYNYRNEYF